MLETWIASPPFKVYLRPWSFRLENWHICFLVSAHESTAARQPLVKIHDTHSAEGLLICIMRRHACVNFKHTSDIDPKHWNRQTGPVLYV